MIIFLWLNSVIEYATVVLMLDKSKHSILSPYIYTLKNNGASDEEIIELLSRVYNFGDPNDLMLIAKAAKSCGVIDLAKMIMLLVGEILEG